MAHVRGMKPWIKVGKEGPGLNDPYVGCPCNEEHPYARSARVEGFSRSVVLCSQTSEPHSTACSFFLFLSSVCASWFRQCQIGDFCYRCGRALQVGNRDGSCL